MSELYTIFTNLHDNILENIVDKLSTKFCFNKKDAINYIKNNIACDTILNEERIIDIDLNKDDSIKNIKEKKEKTEKTEKKKRVKKEVDPDAPKKKRGRPKKQHSIIIDSSDDEKETETKNTENSEDTENNEKETKNDEVKINILPETNSELESINDTSVDNLTEKLIACVV